MANSLTTNPVYIDDFSAAIDMADYWAGQEAHISSIEWARPTNVAHYCTIFSGGSSGVTLFDEQCTVANQSLIKYFYGAPVKHPYIPATAGNLLASGKLIIMLDR